MKIILIVVTLCFPLVTFSQVDICKCAENSLNKESGQRIVQSKLYTIGKNERSNSALLVSVRRIDSVYYLYIISQLPDCAGPKTSVEFTTTAGNKLKKPHIGDVDCGVSVDWLGTTTEVRNVIKLEVNEPLIKSGGLTNIRLMSSEHYASIKIAMPFNLKTVFDCVDKKFNEEAKTKPKQGIQN